MSRHRARLSTRQLILELFPGRESLLLAGVFVTSLLAAVFETVGVASILPFMALVLDPTSLDRYRFLAVIAERIGATTTTEKLLAVGGATALIVAFGNLANAVNVFVQQRFLARTDSRLSATLFTGYMRLPYSFHVQRDAPSVLKVLNVDVNAVVNGVILPLAQGVSRILVGVAILVLLLMHDALIALTVSSILSTVYASTYWLIRRSQQALGTTSNTANLERIRISQESLGGVKELQILGRTEGATAGFASAARRYAGARATQQVVAQMPRYVLETVAFGGILLITLVLVAGSSGSTQAVVPVLALYAFAGYRLLPALQIVFASVIAIGFYRPALESLHADFERVRAIPPPPSAWNTRVGLTSSLRVRNVTFSYEGAVTPALRDVSLTIRAGESIGLVGRTGAGKSTLADLILGLYMPEKGIIEVDGTILRGDTIPSWQRQVGYVPQSVFLANASVAENIAFGLPGTDRDAAAVRDAARLAQAEEFILSLPKGYETLVGERGVKLSGGQRQRIGIARALYHRPTVLVFDEATSALDGLTEEAVMEAIRSLANDRTIILIAHRLRTVEACSRIIMLERGQVVADGPYQQLAAESDTFQSFLGRAADATAYAPT